MARGKGFQGIVGWKKGTTWGTAVVPAAGDGVEVISCGADGGTEPIEDMQITGRVTQREATPGNRNITASLVTALRYEGLEPLIAQVFGTAGTPTTVDTSAKLHVFKIKDNIDGIFGTLAYEYLKDAKVVEAPSVKWQSLSLKFTQGQRIQVDFNGIAFDWKDNSASNTTTSIDSITLPANREYPPFAQMVLRMNAQGGAALGASDVVYVSELELKIERALEARFSTQFGDKCDEPLDTGFCKITGSMTFPALQDPSPGGNAAFPLEQMSLTRKKADIKITSTNLAGGTTQMFQHVLWLPNLQFGPGKPKIEGPQAGQWQLPFTCYHVTTIPTGFTAGYLDAVTYEVYSQRATDALA